MSKTKSKNNSERNSFIDACVQSETDFTELFTFYKNHSTSTVNFDLSELFQTFSLKQFQTVWEHLLKALNIIVTELDKDPSTSQPEPLPIPLLMEKLNCIANFAILTIKCTEKNIDSLESVVEILHKLSLPLTECYPQNAQIMAKVCVEYWQKGFQNKEKIVINAATILILQVLKNTHITANAVKEVYKFREALREINMIDKSSDILKKMFLSAIASANFLKYEDGRKFLAHLFNLHPNIIPDLHVGIQQILPNLNKKQFHSHYGEIYFKAWKNANELCREKLENSCLQDLMYKGILSSRSGQNSFFIIFHRILIPFFENINLAGVGPMMNRLLKPFLWRFLVSTNHQVRANACVYFFEAFPLQDSSLNREELDEYLQRQFDFIAELIKDNSPLVRSIAVSYTFTALTTFWDFFPSADLKTILTILTNEVAFDSNSITTRTNVINGFSQLLTNQSTHSTLANILPTLSNHLHDNSEQVRSAMVELLLKLRQLNTGIKFWNICSIDHLLARVHIDSPDISMKIVDLLISTFLPVNKSGEVQLSRAVKILKINAHSAKIFYSYVHCYLAPTVIMKFIYLLVSYLRKSIEARINTENQNENILQTTPNLSLQIDNLSIISGDGFDSFADSSVNSTVNNRDFIFDNHPILLGFLEIIFIIWYTSIEEIKESPEQYAKLVDKTADSLPLLYNNLAESDFRSAILMIASLIPAYKITLLARNSIENLSIYTPDTTRDVLLPILICIVNWGQGETLLNVIIKSLESIFGKKYENNNTKSKSKQKKVNLELEPELSLHLVSIITNHKSSFEKIIYLPNMVTLASLLRLTTKCIQDIINRDCDNDKITLPILEKAFKTYCQLTLMFMLKHNIGENNIKIYLNQFTTILNWASLLIPEMKSGSMEVQEIRPNRKRKNNRKPPSEHTTLILPNEMYDFILLLFNQLLPLTSDVMLINLTNIDLTTAAIKFCVDISKTNEMTIFYTHLMLILYNTVNITDFDKDMYVFSHLWSYFCEIFHNCLKHVKESSRTRKSTKQELFYVSQTLQTTLRNLARLKLQEEFNENTTHNENNDHDHDHDNNSNNEINNINNINSHVNNRFYSSCLTELAISLNTILLSSIEEHLISIDLNESEIELKSEILPEFCLWLGKLIKSHTMLVCECIHQIESLSEHQSIAQKQAIKLCEKLYSQSK